MDPLPRWRLVEDDKKKAELKSPAKSKSENLEHLKKPSAVAPWIAQTALGFDIARICSIFLSKIRKV